MQFNAAFKLAAEGVKIRRVSWRDDPQLNRAYITFTQCLQWHNSKCYDVRADDLHEEWEIFQEPPTKPQPCPWCHTVPEVISGESFYHVSCPNCPAVGMCVRTREETIRQWNRIVLKPLNE